MATKKGIFKSVGIFVLGFLIGAILVGILMGRNFNTFFRDQYYTQILEATNNAYMIRKGNQDELLKLLESSISQCLVSANSIWGKNKERLSSFWYAQRYYQTFDINMPAEIRPILNSLPPRPPTTCELKKLKIKGDTNNVEPNAIQ